MFLNFLIALLRRINFTKPETKPLTLSRPSISLTLPKKDPSTSGQNNLLANKDKDSVSKPETAKNVVNEYQRETFHVNDDVKVKVTDVSNNGGGGGNKNVLSDNGYHYDKPRITTAEPEPLDRTYLPPKEFIPPANREYLPPTGFEPPKSDY